MESNFRILMSINSNFEELAAVSLLSFLLHNKFQKIVIVTPIDTNLKLLPDISKKFNTEFIHLEIPTNSPSEKLDDLIKPYFYCIESIDLVCNGILSNDPGRYLYIDADTLCIKDISELKNLELNTNKPIAACSHGRPMIDRQLILELESPYHYFNAGLLLFESVELQNKLNPKDVVKFYIENSALCRFREQCVLNYLLKGKVRYLPNQYNYLSWMRLRSSKNHWQQIEFNPMSNCLSDIRNNLAIVHLSNGCIPNKININELETIDNYWIYLYEKINESYEIEKIKLYKNFIDG